MALKKCLGLESSPITEAELRMLILNARRKNLNEIEFTSGQKKVKITLRKVNPEGMMRGNWDYYSAK